MGLLALLLAPALAAPPAWGYVRTRTTKTDKVMWWPRADLSVLLYTGDPPSFLTKEEVSTAVRASAATWNYPQVPCTAIVISVSELDNVEAPVGYDGVNRITFRREDWRKRPCDPAMENCSAYDGRALAITSVFAQTRDGKILDSDMELNGVYRKWGDVVTDRVALMQSGEEIHDLQNTVTHEFGHLIGLDHNCFDPAVLPQAPVDQTGAQVPLCTSAPAEARAATMFNTARPMDIDKRDLAADDIQAVCDIYPVGYKPMLGDDVSGGCVVAGGPIIGPGRPTSAGGPLLGLGLLGLVALGARFSARRRRR
jgi:hypothetical protein